MDRAGKLSHPGWCDNLIGAGGLESGESVLVVVDEPLVEEGSQLIAAVADAGGAPTLELWAGRRPLATAPNSVLAAAEHANLSFFLAQQPRADEAAARFSLMETVIGHGGRQIFLGFVDASLLSGELSQPVPDLSQPARRLLDALRGSDTIRVTGTAGTDLTLRVSGRHWLTDALPIQSGEAANFPGGEIFVAPHADGADGTLVADVTVPYTVEGLVDEPVVLRFAGGRVTSIAGGRAAEMLRRLVEDAGDGAGVIAELGIGVNPMVTPRGHIMLDEKAAGTAHIAIGRNTSSYGGDNEASIHVDCVFSGPAVWADGHPVELP